MTICDHHIISNSTFAGGAHGLIIKIINMLLRQKCGLTKNI